MSEDQFTSDQFSSVQWDRDEVTHPSNGQDVNAANHDVNENNGSKTDETIRDIIEEEPEEDYAAPPYTEQDADKSSEDGDSDSYPNNSILLSKLGDVTPDVPSTIGSTDPTDTTDLFEAYSIETAVTSPIRDLDTHSKGFISYLLTTTTDHPSVLKLSSHKQPSTPKSYITIKTRRRYGDFRILHDCLSNDYPTLLTPPLPSKSNFKYLTGDTFSSEFVHKRLHSLNRFVKFILQHRHLSQLSIFHLFIADSSDWTTFIKNLKLKESGLEDANSAGSAGFVNKVVNEDLITETVMNFLTPAKHKRETNKDILEINDKLKKLYENLTKLDKIFVKLNKKNHDLSVDYENFAAQILKLSIVQQADIDPVVTEPSTPVKALSASQITSPKSIVTTEGEKSILTNFKIFAESLEYFLKNWTSLYTYIDESFLVSLKDCSKYILSLTNLIELQHNKKIDLQVLQDYLVKSRNELSGMTGEASSVPPPNPVLQSNSGGGLVNNTTQLIKDTLSTSATPHIGSTLHDGKILKLQSKIELLEFEIAQQTKLVNDLTNKIINEEYPNWDKFNRNELKDSMVGLCDEQIVFYKGLVDNWSDVELKLLKRLDELA